MVLRDLFIVFTWFFYPDPAFFQLIDDIDSSGEPLGDLGDPTDMIPWWFGVFRWLGIFAGIPSRNQTLQGARIQTTRTQTSQISGVCCIDNSSKQTLLEKWCTSKSKPLTFRKC